MATYMNFGRLNDVSNCASQGLKASHKAPYTGKREQSVIVTSDGDLLQSRMFFIDMLALLSIVLSISLK